MLEIIITSSVLILAILLIRKICWGKISRRLQYGLWILVVARLLVPMDIFTSSLSVMNLVEPAGEAITSHWQTKQDEGESTTTDLDKDYGDLQLGAGVITIEKSDISIETGVQNDMDMLPNEEALVAPGIASAPDWKEMFLEVWKYIYIVGVLITGSCLLLCNLKFHKQLTANRQFLGTEGRLKVYQASGISSPCLWGIFRPAIYLTEQSLEPEERKNHILQHELTHYRHLDHIWALVRSLCLVLYWFHPLVWAAAKLSMEDSELACDEGTFLRLGEEQRTAYGRTLIEMMTEKTKSNRLWYCTTDMINSKSEIKKRITAIAFYKKQIIWITVPVIVAAIFLSACTAGRKEDTEANMMDFFEYMVDLEHPNYAFSIKNLEYGMTQQEVLEAEGLTEEHLNPENGFIITEATYENVPFGTKGETIDTLKMKKRYTFYDETGLSGAVYSWTMDAEYEETMRELLYEQAVEYMPQELNAYVGSLTSLESIKTMEVVGWEDIKENSFDLTGKDISRHTRCVLEMYPSKDGGFAIELVCQLDGRDYWTKEKEYTNIFEYMFDVEDGAYSDYRYTPQGLTYGMSKEEVIESEGLTDYTENHSGNITRKITATDVTEDIKELNIYKYYEFTRGYGLSKVEYYFEVTEEDKDAFIDLLKEQSKEYMPTGIGDDLKEVIWGETLSFKVAKDFTSDWYNRETNKSVASFNGVYEPEGNSEYYTIMFKVANGDSYWNVYNLFHDNFFSYAINLENEEYTYDFRRSDVMVRYQYGDDKQQFQSSFDYGPYAILEENTDSLTVGAVFRDMPTEITEYAYERKFVFDEEFKLTGVEYTLSVKEEEFDTLCNLLYYQAGEYMPMATEGAVKDIQDGKDVSWRADDVSGKTTSRVELTFNDTGDGRKEVTLGIYIEEAGQRVYSNFFAYAIKLTNKDWIYEPAQLRFGMSKEEVLDAEGLDESAILATDNEVIFAKETIYNVSDTIEEMCMMLYEQALSYMPNAGEKSLERIRDGMDLRWNGHEDGSLKSVVEFSADEFYESDHSKRIISISIYKEKTQ